MAGTTGAAEALRRTELFRGFGDRDLDQIASIAEEVTLGPGEKLCEQGRVADACWVVLEGEAAVEIGDGTLVSVVGPGESVGEMGLLDHLPRSATVVSRTPMRLLRIDAARFDDLLGASPLARGLLEVLSLRIRDLEHGRALLH